jgi:glycosyltransferase involved in cell wall biosynthesis
MLNVLIFSHSSGLGGAERSLLTLVTDLIKDYNTQITVVLPPDGPSIDLLKKAGATVLPAPIHLWCTTNKLSYKDEGLERQLKTFDWLINHLEDLRSLSPDIILTNTIVIPWGGVAAALLKRPHIWLINEFGELDHGFSFFHPFADVLGLIEQSSDVIVTRSLAIRETLFPHLEEDQVKTIYRSIELPAEASRREKPFHSRSTYLLAIIGTIRESKGQQDAVEAVIELRKNCNRQVELVMVGHAEEPYRNALTQLARDNGVEEHIHIVPFQKNVYSIMEQADAILLCSRMEAFSRVTLESMLVGKPFIGTNTGGTPEMIQDGETGLLYEPGNIPQLVEKIEWLMDHPDWAREIAQKATGFARSTFTKEKYAGEFHKLINSVVSKPYQEKIAFSHFILGLYQDLCLQKSAMIRDQEIRNQNLEQEALYYATSKSWRWTEPLRKLTHLFKRK